MSNLDLAKKEFEQAVTDYCKAQQALYKALQGYNDAGRVRAEKQAHFLYLLYLAGKKEPESFENIRTL